MKLAFLESFLVMVFIFGKVAWAANGCQFKAPQVGTEVRPGYNEWMDKNRLAPFKNALPEVDEPEISAILKSSDTMWYDEASMIFLYQDSIESVVGGRANCVGRSVGENPPAPEVGKLKNFFGPDYRFVFPFRKAAGTDNVTNEAVINFWAPPKVNGKTLPVKYWRAGSRGHWYWTFPFGTVFGEILFEKADNGSYYVFEIRTRKRYRDGWSVNLFRPFATAEDLASAIIQRRPDWQQDANLMQVVNHLRNPATLTPYTLASKGFASVFQAIQGALDIVPDIADKSLVRDLLTTTKFISMEGKVWKKNGALETYAPSSAGEFSIVPKGYEAGMLAVNEVSCTRCHTETSRKIAHFDFDTQLYGEIWGEDRIFTWHPFDPNTSHIYATFDDADGSRLVNNRLVQAGLLVQEKPSSNDANYKPLPSAFDMN
jgi:hypothetical protein